MDKLKILISQSRATKKFRPVFDHSEVLVGLYMDSVVLRNDQKPGY